MILAEKIMILRKQMGWSQEELADKLQVSRQSVSKWELGASIPDLDKILKMSELFGVSTDYLLKETMSDAEYLQTEEEAEGCVITAEAAAEYTGLIESRSSILSYAISIFILSPVVLILMAGLSELGVVGENLAVGIGLVCLFVMVIIGVAICVLYGLQVEKFKFLEDGDFTLQYGVEGIIRKKKEDFAPKTRLFYVIGICMCIASCMPLIIMGLMENEFGCIVSVCILLAIVSVAVNLFVRVGVINEAYTKLLKTEEYEPKNRNLNKAMGTFRTLYWLSAVAIYLYINIRPGSDYKGSWGDTAYIFVIAGVLFAGVDLLIQNLVSYFQNKSEKS